MILQHHASPLLTLPPPRVARERQLLAAQDAADRRWGKIIRRTVAKALAWYLVGLFLIGFSWHTTNYDLAGYFYVAGMYVCALGHTFTVVNFWLRECY
jgi:hypothetical protein